MKGVPLGIAGLFWLRSQRGCPSQETEEWALQLLKGTAEGLIEGGLGHQDACTPDGVVFSELSIAFLPTYLWQML